MKYLSEAQCFTSKDLSCVPQILPDRGGLHVNGKFIQLPDGAKIKSASWNADDALEVVGSNGVCHYFVGQQRSFNGSYNNDFKGSGPVDAHGYKKALKECQEFRRAQEDEHNAKEDRKRSKADRKSRCGFCSVLKCLLKIIFGWLCICIQLDTNEE